MRDFKTFFAPHQIDAYQQGTLGYTYKGVPCLKSPIDIALYLHLLSVARPRTIFEIGSKAGGSALMFRDFARLHALDAEVVSIDLAPPTPPPDGDGIRFLEGDANALRTVFDRHDLWNLPRPFMVIEDSAHAAKTCLAVLKFFAETLRPEEYLVMEDGVLDELGLSEKYEGGPNRAIAAHLARHPDCWEVDSTYCDMFGLYATYNPNGYLKRTSAPWKE